MTIKMFSPIKVGPHVLKNRIVLPAMHLGLCEAGRVSARELQFYQERAAHGVGLVMVGLCNTYREVANNIVGVLELSDDTHIDSMAELHQVISMHGAKSAVQLSPLVGYNNPSFVPDASLLRELIDSVGRAAKRAQSAGFDYVELMLSGGSLFSHLLSPKHNQYGLEQYSGSLENRLRAACEALAKIKEHAPQMPITVRMHGHEYLEGGYGLDEAASIAKRLEQQGICALNVTVAGHRTQVPQITRHRTAASFSFLGRNIKDAVSIPVFFGGRIRSFEDAQKVMEESSSDCLTIGRSLIADASWVEKLEQTQRKKAQFCAKNPINIQEQVVSNCIGCCHCLDMAFSKKPVACTVNPLMKWQTEIGQDAIDALGSQNNVLVVGSGPAGLSAAIMLANKGKSVTIAEKEAQLGGKWRMISQLRGHEELSKTLSGYIDSASKLGIQFKLSTAVDSQMVKSLSPDLVVWAAGAAPRHLSLPGIETHPNVFHVGDILEESIGFSDLAVVGGNAVGVTAAIHLAKRGMASDDAVGYLYRYGNEQWGSEALAYRPKRTITILKRRGFVGKGMGRATRWSAVNDLEKFGVNILDRVSYEQICSDGIWIQNGRTKERAFIRADLIILATGFEPLAAPTWLAQMGLPVWVVGDAKKIGNMTDAIEGIFHCIDES